MNQPRVPGKQSAGKGKGKREDYGVKLGQVSLKLLHDILFP